MKTQVNEWSEVKNQGILIIAFYVFIVAGIFIVSGGRSVVLDREVTDHHSYGTQEAVEEESDIYSATPAFLSEEMMMNLQEALMPIEEHSLSLSGVNNIQFPVETNDEKNAETSENSYLNTMLIQKNKEVAKECAMYWELKECLKKESEQPLQIENWMTDEQIWNNKTMTDKKID